MPSGSVTTPFGRRPMKLALMKGQIETALIKPGRSVDKWRVFRDIAEARSALGLQDRSLAVLNALLSFYPETKLSEEHGLVVFPSNAQLSLRAHGMAGTTLRRHLAALVEAGIIHRRDSPNGKRYAHRGRNGKIEQAFGFNLAPLIARAAEFSLLAQRVVEERRALKIAKESLSLCRRDIRKLIAAAVEEGAEGDWPAFQAHYTTLMDALPRSASRQDINATLKEMEKLRLQIINALETQANAKEMDTNDSQSGCHIQSPESDSIHESEKGMERVERNPKPCQSRQPDTTLPIGFVVKACPQIVDYAPGGRIDGWRDLISAAVVVRSMLGVSPEAFQEACEVMEPTNAAVTMAYILEKTETIASPGGYLRDLTRRAERGAFSIKPLLMAQLRAHTGSRKQ